jgi:hypothetical protein
VGSSPGNAEREHVVHAAWAGSPRSPVTATVPAMAGENSTSSLGVAAAVAAGTGAAQLGLGYGLGVIVWPDTVGADDSVWLGSLSWATWTAASATVFGAVVAGRLRGADAGRPGALLRFAIAAASAVGALLTVALIALPARGAAVRSEAATPQAVAAGYALIGLVLGLVVAYWAVVSRPVAANLVTTAVWLWLLAAAAVVADLVAGRPSATFLTSWQFAELDGALRYGTIYWPSALLTLLAAFLIGLVAAWPAARRGELGLGTAVSGAVGPLLVAAAFFALAPQLTRSMGPLESAYLIAPYGVLAGLAGSALAVAAGRSAERRRAERAARSADRPAAPPHGTGSTDTTAGRTGAMAGTDPATAPAGRTGVTAGTDPATAPAAGRPYSTGAPAGRPAGPRPGDGPTDTGAGGVATAGATAVRPRSGAGTSGTPASSAGAGPQPGVPAGRTPAPDTAAGPESRGSAGAPAATPPRPPRGRKAPAQRPTPPPPEPEKPAPGRGSTVSAPPAQPPVARINPPDAG